MVYSGNTITMLQDALIKCLEGKTSFEEVYRTIEIENEDGDNYYVDIINLVKDNPPLLLVKNFITDEINNINEGFSIDYIDTMDFHLLLNLCQYLIDNNIIEYDENFLTKYIGESKSESTITTMLNDLNAFKQQMEVDFQPNKISESFIKELDESYVSAQIIYSTINID